MHVLLQPLQTCAEDTAYRTEQRIFAARRTEVRRRNRNARRARLGEGFDRLGGLGDVEAPSPDDANIGRPRCEDDLSLDVLGLEWRAGE